MGSCVSSPSASQKPERPPRDKHHPMQNIKINFSVDSINEQWGKKEKKTLQAKVSRLENKPISFKRFQEIFPKLLHFSEKTQKRFFKLFAYEGGSEITIPEFLQTLTIIKKVTESSDLAPLIFFAYSHDKRQEVLKPQEFDLFLNENKGFLKVVSHTEIEELEEQLNNGTQLVVHVDSSQTLDLNKTPQKVKAEVSENSSPLSVSQMRPSSIIKKKVNCKLAHFCKFFQAYNLSSYQFLFTWDLQQEQRELVSQISKEGIVRHKGDRVCLVEYQWFLSWLQYIERRFHVRLEIKDGGEEQNYKSTRRKSKDHRMSQSSKIDKPGEIKNHILKTGKRDHELQPNLVEQQTHISVRENLWDKLVGIYSGGPVIPRIYPKTYYNVVVKVFLAENGKFIPMSKKVKQSNEQPTVGRLASHQQSTYICYYKYPGKSDWRKLQNKQARSEQIFNGPRTYLTFVPKRIEEEFLSNYAIKVNAKKERFLKERFAHYGNEVNISIGGVLTAAEVVDIKDERNITVEFQDDLGITQSLEIVYSETFEKFNPAELGKEGQINQLAGLDNIGNTCYMNAVIQCLIRTPSFGNYLEQQEFGPEEELLIQEIAKIYLSSKTTKHQSINTRPFKRIFEKHCPYFEGYTQHDAQQFLICLLQRLTEQIRHKRKQFGIKSEIGQAQIQKTNKKVQKFFSGKTKATTKCKKCRNQGSITEPFFTYSLSLPLQPEVEFFYTFVPHYKSKRASLTPIKYGITLPRRATVSDLLQAVKKRQKKRQKKYELLMYTIFNNEILNRLQYSSYERQLSYYLHFNAKLALFEVEDDLTPTFNDFQKKKFEGKSVKLQLRQRIYSDKTKEYKSVFHPFILEVTHSTTWEDLLELINNTLNRLGKAEQAENQSLNQKAFRASQIKFQVLASSRGSSAQQAGIKSSQSQIVSRGERIAVPLPSKLPEYRINIIKNDPNYENNCMLCKEELFVPKHLNKKTCSGCKFNPGQPLFEQSEFRNFWDCILIVIDWLASVPEFQHNKNDSSVEACIKKAEGRREVLSSLLQDNFNRSQELQLRCQRPQCGYELADRSEKIVIFPNILLLHLKRFTYQDNMLVKLNTAVEYPQQLRLSAEEDYELYGVVSHYGSGVGGHYVAYVRVAQRWYRCDDSRVSFAADRQFIDSNAYLLFYRKKGFQPSLITLSF